MRYIKRTLLLLLFILRRRGSRCHWQQSIVCGCLGVGVCSVAGHKQCPNFSNLQRNTIVFVIIYVSSDVTGSDITHHYDVSSGHCRQQQ